jgi:twitching motility protein PilT
MMTAQTLIGSAAELGASDVHLEPGLPVALRIRGELQLTGEPVPASELLVLAREWIGDEDWPSFLGQRSFDLSRTIAGTRCRINLLHTHRGVGMAIRLFTSFQPTIERLNLHPDFRRFIHCPQGLVLVSGPTGSGKSSTLAALIQEINLTEARHIVTIEHPIEYFFRPQRAFIRQREVGRDTPSFQQALLDVLREDPDVVMVGEMREPETMRLTLNAAETGHLVMATVHSSNCVEALQRVVAAFPAEIQSAVAAQLADCLMAVIAQRLQFRANLNLRVPECEVLTATHPVKAHIRNRDFFKISSVLETGADGGMWTFARYRNWLDRRTRWFIPEATSAVGPPDDESRDAGTSPGPVPPVSAPSVLPGDRLAGAVTKRAATPSETPSTTRPIEIEPVEGGLDALLRKLK